MSNQQPEKQVGGAAGVIGDITPKLASLTDDVLFADVWNRPGLSARDRSLITVASLITGGNIAQLGGHLKRALGNGVTADELVEVVTHLAFYAEWPKAMSAAAALREAVGVQRPSS